MKAEVHGIECNFSLSNCQAFGQRTMIGEAIGNLVDNALVNRPVGSQVSISCGAEDIGEKSLFEVLDNSPSIDAEYFDRAPDSVSTGSGLGLAIAQAVAKKNQLGVELTKVEPHGLRAKLLFSLI